MLHTIRQIVGDDERWRGILRGLNEEFRHRTVTGEQVQEYVSEHAGLDLSHVFRQYLTSTQVPVLEYRQDGRTLSYRWAEVVPGFDMPVAVTLSGVGRTVLHPTEEWKTMTLDTTGPSGLAVDPDYYVEARALGAGSGR
jgi:aminopeptidase N